MDEWPYPLLRLLNWFMALKKATALPAIWQLLKIFCSRLITLPYSDTALIITAVSVLSWSLAGQTIGVNDLHIAAHARSQGLVLVSNNLREFERVSRIVDGKLGGVNSR